MKTKKGFYSIVTTFLFILITLAVVIGLVYFINIVTGLKERVHKEEDLFVKGQIVRDTLYGCYGDVVQETLINNRTCISGENLSISEEFLLAWQLEKYAYKNCSAKNWSSRNISQIEGTYRNIVVYTIPLIQEDTGFTCPAQLHLYMK